MGKEGAKTLNKVLFCSKYSASLPVSPRMSDYYA